MDFFRDWLSILRYHIVLVAMAATLVFGRLLCGGEVWALALFAGLDWLLINLFNKATDVEEDLANAIAGTQRVARHRAGIVLGCWSLMLGSFALTAWAFPELLGLRILVQLIGLGYSYPWVPTPSGFRRFKEIYFLKNFMSAVLFVLTCFLYPLAHAGWTPVADGWTFVLLMLFFVPFELTYEILYDLRDLEGDRQEGIPTYPVVHGPLVARQIIDGLLLGSGMVLCLGFLTANLGLQEGLFLAAPVIQFFFYRPRFARGLTSWDCVLLTHLGTGLLLFFLVGNSIWLAAGMPKNLYLF